MDPGFSREGRQSQRHRGGGAQPIIRPNAPENCMKMNTKLGRYVGWAHIRNL